MERSECTFLNNALIAIEFFNSTNMTMIVQDKSSSTWKVFSIILRLLRKPMNTNNRIAQPMISRVSTITFQVISWTNQSSVSRLKKREAVSALCIQTQGTSQLTWSWTHVLSMPYPKRRHTVHYCLQKISTKMSLFEAGSQKNLRSRTNLKSALQSKWPK